MNKIIKKLTKDFTDDTFHEISPLGSYQIYLLIALIYFLFQKRFETIFLLIGFFIMNIIAIPIRYYLFKERPKPKKYTNKIEKIFASSFPSMHTTRIIFLSLFLLSTLQNTYIQPIILMLATIIIYSRIYNKRHHPSDILGGVILGILTFIFTNIILL